MAWEFAGCSLSLRNYIKKRESHYYQQASEQEKYEKSLNSLQVLLHHQLCVWVSECRHTLHLHFHGNELSLREEASLWMGSLAFFNGSRSPHSFLYLSTWLVSLSIYFSRYILLFISNLKKSEESSWPFMGISQASEPLHTTQSLSSHLRATITLILYSSLDNQYIMPIKVPSRRQRVTHTAIFQHSTVAGCHGRVSFMIIITTIDLNVISSLSRSHSRI